MAAQGRAQREGTDVYVQFWLWKGVWGDSGCCCTPVCLYPDTPVRTTGTSSQFCPKLCPDPGDGIPWAEGERWEEEEENPDFYLPGVCLI